MEVMMNWRRVTKLFKLDDFVLLSGNDFPFESARLIVHPPHLREIAFLGEESFFLGCQMLNFSKSLLKSQDKVVINDVEDFDILMAIMMDKSQELKNQQECAIAVLGLLFPKYNFTFTKDGIVFINQEDKTQMGTINKMNFDEFKKILAKTFCLGSVAGAETEYNPNGKLAQKLVDKFKERHEKLAQLQGDSANDKHFSVLGRYLSILTVGTSKDMNEFLDYTVFQLFDEYRRYELKMQYDIYFKARMAGAKDIKEPENWMKDLYEGSLS